MSEELSVLKITEHTVLLLMMHVELTSMVLVATFIETAGLGAELDRHAHCAQYLITHNRRPFASRVTVAGPRSGDRLVR
jgi:hypothetical protein